MESWLLLLRAINVGGKNKLPMTDLKAAIIEAGGSDPQTYIQSGNAVFHGTVEPDALGQAISSRAGFTPDFMMFSAEDFHERCASNPFTAIEDGKTVHAWLMTRTPDDDAQARLEALSGATETVKLIGRTAWLHAPDGIGRSRLARDMEKGLGVSATARNRKTLDALAPMLDVAENG